MNCPHCHKLLPFVGQTYEVSCSNCMAIIKFNLSSNPPTKLRVTMFHPFANSTLRADYWHDDKLLEFSDEETPPYKRKVFFTVTCEIPTSEQIHKYYRAFINNKAFL